VSTDTKDDPLDTAIRQAVRHPRVIEAFTTALEAQMRATFQQQLGGAPLYIAKRASRTTLEVRNERIRSAFHGDNLDQVAREYGLHPRHVRRIVGARKK
jgi:Mor family transcriptional regulator